MTPFSRLLLCACSLAASSVAVFADSLPSAPAVLEKMQLVNSYFMKKWPDPGLDIVTNRKRPSNIWTRGVYYEGVMDLYRLDRDPAVLAYTLRWAEHHKWGLRNGVKTRNADDQCCGQTYLDLYDLDPKPERLRDIQASMDNMIAGGDDDWWWIDALQMAMPVFAKLSVITKDPKYVDKMHALYLYAKNKHGGKGLYNPADGLWWRDKDFVPPYAEPNGEDCYWSRGNGWVIAALVRTLDLLPADSQYRAEYTEMLKTMCEAVRKVQRDDGFWNASLHDPKNYGGKEASGTALFVYGMAWGVRNGVLPRDVYEPVVIKGWKALVDEAVQPTGYLGYVQSTGKEPKDGQPVTLDKIPDFEDYGIGCFLLAGSEVYKLSGGKPVPAVSAPTAKTAP